jgi:Zn-dependent peptidase ImmA (M78 family)
MMTDAGLPKELVIATLVHRVVTDDNIAAEDNHYGECNHRQLVITIDGGAHQDRQKQTLLHEVLEAVNHEYHIDLSHNQIEQLECAMFAFLRDNPGVF